jgi:hypothetical protein
MAKFNPAKDEQRESVPLPSSYNDRQFLHTYLAGAFLPLIQSSITAMMVSIVTSTILYLFDAIDILKPSLVAGVFVWVAMWIYLQRRWLNLTMLERALNLDLNKDGSVGELIPARPETVIRIDEVKSNGHFQSSTYRLPVKDDVLTALAHGLLSGRPLSEREWTGAGKLFSSAQWRRLIQVMLTRDLARYVSDRDPRQGVELTERGWAMMEQLIAEIEEVEVMEE